MTRRRKYVIASPCPSASVGVRVLHKLRDELVARGYEAGMFYWQDRKAPGGLSRDAITPSVQDSDVAVYPETVWGNPLGFRNVARWVLNTPGKRGGAAEVSADEMVFSFDQVFLSGYPYLKFDTVDHSLFYEDRSVEKDTICTFVYKGGKCRDIPEEVGAKRITMQWPPTRRECADLLRRTKVLYTFDGMTSLIDEAVLCGAKVKIVTPDGFVDPPPIRPFDKELFEAQINEFIRITQTTVCGKPALPALYSRPRWQIVLLKRIARTAYSLTRNERFRRLVRDAAGALWLK